MSVLNFSKIPHCTILSTNKGDVVDKPSSAAELFHIWQESPEGSTTKSKAVYRFSISLKNFHSICKLKLSVKYRKKT